MRRRRTALACAWLLLILLNVSAQQQNPADTNGHQDAISSVAFSADGKTLASASMDRTVILWDVASGRQRLVLNGHSSYVYAVAFSPQSAILASGGGDRTIKLWDAQSGKELRTLTGHVAGIESLAFSPDGKLLASGDYEGQIKLWDTSAYAEIRTLKNGPTTPSLAFSADGKFIASASSGPEAKIWDVATGKEISTLKSEGYTFEAVAFSRDGKELATGVTFYDRDAQRGGIVIKLWDIATGKERRTLKAESARIYSLAFTPDGKTLVSGSYGGSLVLWDTESWTPRNRLAGHSSPIQAIALKQDGTVLASAGGSYGRLNSSILLWDIRQPATSLGTLTGPDTGSVLTGSGKRGREETPPTFGRLPPSTPQSSAPNPRARRPTLPLPSTIRVDPLLLPQAQGGYGSGTGTGMGPGRGGDGGNAPSNAGPSASSGPVDYKRVFGPREVTKKAVVRTRPEPSYTEKARFFQITGTVSLRAVMSATGEIINIVVVSELPYGLTDKAIAAAKQIKFTPAEKDGHLVSQSIRIEYNFNLY